MNADPAPPTPPTPPGTPGANPRGITVDPATRRANFWLFLLLILFAIGLCLMCLFWMRHRTLQDGGTVYPPPPPSPATSFRAPVSHFPLAFTTHRNAFYPVL